MYSTIYIYMYIVRYKRAFIIGIGLHGVPQVAQVVPPPANAGAVGGADSILGWEDPLEEEMATHSSILAWKIIWTEDPGGLQSMKFQSWIQLKGLNLHRVLEFETSHGLCHLQAGEPGRLVV